MKSRSPTSSATRAYDASGRQADAQARRDRVVEVAANLFRERGFGGTSIGDIARAAGVSTQFVYAAFESKAGVLARAVDVAVAGDTADIPVSGRPESVALRAEPDVRQRLAGAVRLLCASHTRAAALIHVVESASAADPALAALATKLSDALRADVRTFLDALPTGALRRDAGSVDHVADAIAALVAARMWTTLVGERGWTPEEFERFVLDAIDRLFFA